MRSVRKRKANLGVCLSWHAGGSSEEEHGAGSSVGRLVLCVLAMAVAGIVIVGLYREFLP